MASKSVMPESTSDSLNQVPEHKNQAPNGPITSPNKPSSFSSSVTSSREGSPIEERLPQQVANFFNTVSPEGFPTSPQSTKKEQPWKGMWRPKVPSQDGKLLVACPKICVYGSNNLGGL